MLTSDYSLYSLISSMTSANKTIARSKKKAQARSIKKTRKKPAHAVAEKKPALAIREPQPSWIEEFNKLSEPFRLIPWDPFRGFEWPVEYELPTRVPYVDVIDSGNEYVVKA